APGSHPVPIGLPIAGAEAYILDQNGNLSLENIVGELHIGGKGLARGYLNDPGLTTEKFIDNPFDPSGSRLYKTGDLCYRLTDGRIVFVGRVDEQVKINGHRIELGEIESSILRINGVRQVVVIA